MEGKKYVSMKREKQFTSAFREIILDVGALLILFVANAREANSDAIKMYV